MTEKWLDSVINDHGYYNLEHLVAKRFVEYTGVNEINVLAVINTQYVECLGKMIGRGKHEKAIKRACELLLQGYEAYRPGSTVGAHRPATVHEFMAMRHHAYVYGALVAMGVKLPPRES